jgi:poly-gamma-glutamate capsule biosynthesis protein CapA/YwtB (metallophosphatase superfamily)
MRNNFPAFLIFFLFGLAACTTGGANTPIIPTPSFRVTPTPTQVPPFPPVPDMAAITPTAAPTSTFQVTLAAVGDIMLARTVGDQVLMDGPQIVFAGVQSILNSADIRVGNLECAIGSRGQAQHKTFTFQAPLETVRSLSLAGFDVLSLANNHAMDYGYLGLSDTQIALGRSSIATVGAGLEVSQAHAPVIIERNGLRLAFLAYADVLPENSGFDTHTWVATQVSPGIAWADPARIKADVTAARLRADLVIVMLHSGIEITSVINNITNEQRLEAHTAIDAGAALVIGSHPHVLQQIERYHGGLIAYSLGNFVFDQYAGIANATVILRVTLTRNGVQGYDYTPVLIDKGLPHVITDNLVPAIGTLVAPPNQ